MIIKIAMLTGLMSLSSCDQRPTAHNHSNIKNYNYKDCTNGINNKKNGESIRTDDGDGGWNRRTNTDDGRTDLSDRELSTSTLYRRGHRTFIIERSGYPVSQGQRGGRVK